MLYLSGEMSKPRRIQSPYISEEEVKKVSSFLAKSYENEVPSEIDFTAEVKGDSALFSATLDGDDGDDDLYDEAKSIVLEAGKASTSYLQRKLRVGYARAARLMDLLEERGVIGPADGSRPREVLDQGGGTSEAYEEIEDESYEEDDTDAYEDEEAEEEKR